MHFHAFLYVVGTAAEYARNGGLVPDFEESEALRLERRAGFFPVF